MELLWLFLIPLLTGLACCIPSESKWLGRIQIIGMSLLLVAGADVTQKIMTHGPLHAGGNWFYLDALSGLMILLICLLSFVASIYASGYMVNEVEERLENLWKLKGFYGLLNLFL